MAIGDNYLQKACFAVAIVGVAVAILATALRFVATKRSARQVGWEDWFAVLATLFYIFYVVPFFYLLVLLNGREVMELKPDELVVLTKAITPIQAGYSMSAQFCLQQLFAKLSLLFLYHRMFRTNRAFVRCMYIVGFVQLGWSIGTYVAHWLVCTPPQKLWNPKVPGKCIDTGTLLVAGETINSLIDFILVGLAIWMVQSLQMKTSVKLKLSVIFAIGGLAGILGFVKIGQGFSQMDEFEIAFYDPLWATIQQGCSVICCCVPIYKPLIPSLDLFSRVRSLGSRTFGRRSGSRSQSKEDDKEKLPLDSLQVSASSWDQTSVYRAHDTTYPGAVEHA